jgi:hypothetical protein
MISITSEEDSHSWRLESSGSFSSKSAYQAFFNGSTFFEPWCLIWKSWVPSKCKVFLWLSVWNKCWIADLLAKWNLPHPNHYPLCDQADETIQHLLTSCVFTRDFWCFTPIGLQQCVSNSRERTFAEWWQKACERTPKR